MTCPSVPRVASVTGWPAFGTLTPVLMALNCTWLNVLNVSSRNWTVTRSPMRVFLNSEMSHWLMPGPRRKPFGVEPSVPSADARTRAG